MALVIGTNVPETLDDADGVTEASDDIFGHGGGDVIFGLGGADDIFGGSGDDYIMGGGGADDIDGEGGDDDADYGDSNAAVQVSLLTGDGTGGTAQGDELESIENLLGSPHDDLLVGDDNVNVLMGLVGDERSMAAAATTNSAAIAATTRSMAAAATILSGAASAPTTSTEERHRHRKLQRFDNGPSKSAS